MKLGRSYSVFEPTPVVQPSFLDFLPDFFRCSDHNNQEEQTSGTKMDNRERRFIGSTPMKEKKAKGINIFCRAKGQSFVKVMSGLKFQEDWIDKWNNIIGERTKLGSKLYRKINHDFLRSENQTKNILKTVQAYRPDFTNEDILKPLISFLLNYSMQKQAIVFKLTIAISTLPMMLPFVTDDQEQIPIIEDLVEKYKLSKVLPLGLLDQEIRNFVVHFVIKLFKIITLIKESNPKGVGERIFTVFLKKGNIEVISRLMALVINSNPNNYGKVIVEEGQFLEISLEELKKFQKQIN